MNPTSTFGAFVLSLLVVPCFAQVAAPLQERLEDEVGYDAAAPGSGWQTEAEDLSPLVVQGNVFHPDGRPASGAVVVSSAGGLAEVQADGSFRLEVRVPPGVSALQLTAAANGPQGPLSARETVHGIPSGGNATSGPMHLTSGAGCTPDWIPTFGGEPGTNWDIYALAVFDDGSGGGPELYLGGRFSLVGGQSISAIAKWDGQGWSAVGGGVSDTSDGAALSVNALLVYDDGSGSGPGLYAGGNFLNAGGSPCSRIGRWDGQSWSPLGNGLTGTWGEVLAMVAHDDGLGGGPALYVGGTFPFPGTLPNAGIAKWDGQNWSPLGSGMNHSVMALASFTDGSGSALYAGGRFTLAGGESVRRLAKWDGQEWHSIGGVWNPVGTLGQAQVHALAVYKDGTRDVLVVGGWFEWVEDLAARNIAKWNGQDWSTLGMGMNGRVNVLKVHGDGTPGGSVLLAGGHFITAGNGVFSKIAKWDGQSWSGFGDGIGGGASSANVHALAVFSEDPGGVATLYAAGRFQSAGGVIVSNIARWDGQSWGHLGQGLNWDVLALTVHDDGSGGGPALYAGGRFDGAAGEVLTRVGRWDGERWTALGAGFSHVVNALIEFDDGLRGSALYAGGQFSLADGLPASRIAKWDGVRWSNLGNGVNNSVYALAVFDDGSGGGPALYVGGLFTGAGGVAASRVARWDGQDWSGLGGVLNREVRALAVFDDGSGSGPALYAGGIFDHLDGQPVNRFVKWDGQGWIEVGGGVGPSGGIFDMAVFDDGLGNGPALYVCGGFAEAGGQPINHIARWDGLGWSSLGSGPNFGALSLAVFDDGSGGGPALYVGGEFTSVDGQAANHIARWDGLSWSPLGAGMNAPVRVLVGFDDGSGSGPALHAGGNFRISPAADSYLAKWGCPPPPALGAAYCFGDGSGTACPCGNAGSAGEGCANSTGQGAVLGASGSASASAADLVLAATNLPLGQFGLFFQATGRANGGDGIVLGDGLFCASGPTVRLEVAAIDAAGASSTTVDIASLGGLTGGETRTYQLWYRDTAASPCGNGFNTSNGLELVWAP